jgi:hypothetical protein
MRTRRSIKADCERVLARAIPRRRPFGAFLDIGRSAERTRIGLSSLIEQSSQRAVLLGVGDDLIDKA